MRIYCPQCPVQKLDPNYYLLPPTPQEKKPSYVCETHSLILVKVSVFEHPNPKSWGVYIEPPSKV